MGIRSKSSQIEVPERNPFQNDKLARKPAIDMLTKLVLNMPTPFVLGIDSEWGTGKTTFVRMWKTSMENKGFRCIYFNAWENDFAEDSFISFVGSIKKEFGKSAPIDKMVVQAKSLGGLLLKKGLPVAARLATAGIVDLGPEIEKALSKASEDVVGEAIKDYEKTQNATVKFKESLQNIALKHNESQEVDRPIILFVDELDRCRPSYALQLLERIKHIFSAEGFVFVLSLDRKQIGTSLRALYGSETNAEAYLRRIVDMDYTLPIPERTEFITTQLNENLRELLMDRDVPASTARNLISLITDILSLSLRDIEHFFTVLESVLVTYKDEDEIPLTFFLWMLAVRISNKILYESIMAGVPDAEKPLVIKIQNAPQMATNADICHKIICYMEISKSSKRDLEVNSVKIAESHREANSSGRLADHLQNFWYMGLGMNVRTRTDQLIKSHLQFS